EASSMSRQCRHAVVGFFERELLLIAHQPAEEVGGKGATSEELGMCAAIRNAREGKRRSGEDFAHEIGVEAAIRTQELSLEIGRDRQVEHRLDRMLPFF